MRSHPDIKKILLDENTILNRIDKLAEQINDDYTDIEKIMIVSILKGAFMFTSDLLKRINIPHIVDFMALSIYGVDLLASGDVGVSLDLRHPV